MAHTLFLKHMAPTIKNLKHATQKGTCCDYFMHHGYEQKLSVGGDNSSMRNWKRFVSMVSWKIAVV